MYRCSFSGYSHINNFFFLGQYQKMDRKSPFPWRNDKIIVMYYIIFVYQCTKIRFDFLFRCMLYVHLIFFSQLDELGGQENSSYICYIYLHYDYTDNNDTIVVIQFLYYFKLIVQNTYIFTRNMLLLIIIYYCLGLSYRNYYNVFGLNLIQTPRDKFHNKNNLESILVFL